MWRYPFDRLIDHVFLSIRKIAEHDPRDPLDHARWWSSPSPGVANISPFQSNIYCGIITYISKQNSKRTGLAPGKSFSTLIACAYCKWVIKFGYLPGGVQLFLTCNNMIPTEIRYLLWLDWHPLVPKASWLRCPPWLPGRVWFLLGGYWHTVRTEIIENGAKTSRISGFGLGGENRARGFSFSPHLGHRPY